jgi:hypothetical protein
MKLTTLLQIAGALHLGLIWAGATMPVVVNLRDHLAPLPPFIRRLFWVYYSFIGLLLVGFGAFTLAFAERLASGDSLARALCAFLAVFWIIRLGVAAFVFDVRPYLRHWFYRLGYGAANAVFVYLSVVYAWGALKGGAL